MSRTLCQQCHRPEKACICTFATRTDNHIHVVVLQHPTEVKQSKGTVALLQQSLVDCDVIVGESFDDSPSLSALLSHYGDQIALLYPSEEASVIDFSSKEISDTHESELSKESNTIKCIVILDGTWKKSYRMFMLNPSLHGMKHLVLPMGIESLYNIRKTKKDNALSSLEACCHALSRLENNPEKYQPLLNNFIKFNQFQQSFNQQNDILPKTP
jgi:DTW domain-containing protein YfiP